MKLLVVLHLYMVIISTDRHKQNKNGPRHYHLGVNMTCFPPVNNRSGAHIQR